MLAKWWIRTVNNFILIFLRIVFLVLLSLVIIMCLRWSVTDGHEGAWRAPFCRKGPDMRFVQKFTLPDFQAKNFALSISHNFNSFSDKKTQKMSENGETFTAGKNFTLMPAWTAWTNLTTALKRSVSIGYPRPL